MSFLLYFVVVMFAYESRNVLHLLQNFPRKAIGLSMNRLQIRLFDRQVKFASLTQLSFENSIVRDYLRYTQLVSIRKLRAT